MHKKLLKILVFFLWATGILYVFFCLNVPQWSGPFFFIHTPAVRLSFTLWFYRIYSLVTVCVTVIAIFAAKKRP